MTASKITWMCRPHLAVHDRRHHVFTEYSADISWQFLGWLLSRALQPFLYKHFKQLRLCWRWLLPQAFRIKVTDSLDRVWRSGRIEIAVNPNVLGRDEHPHRALHSAHISFQLLF